MSEFRKDPLSDHWVIIAPNRAERPEQFETVAPRGLPGRCPFCRGHEADTPPQTAAYSDTGQMITDGPWQVRVIPNKYPAVSNLPPQDQPERDFYHTRPGAGVHEVIVECPDHVTAFGQLDDRQAALVFRAYRDRMAHWRNDPRLAYAQLFKNSGAAAGASLEHAHSQLIATTVVPTQLQSELVRSQTYFDKNGRCVFCEMIRRELATGTRVVAECDRFVVFCPFASQFPYETWILPREHSSHFEFTEDGQLDRLAGIVRDLVGQVEHLLNDPGFNYLIHTAPFDSTHLKHYHWHLEIFPRVSKTAGFEWGAGDYINIVTPEQAAATLRTADRLQPRLRDHGTTSF
jgi:UDPglucose--hexose-1-phosphate uridylyltransferase